MVVNGFMTALSLAPCNKSKRRQNIKNQMELLHDMVFDKKTGDEISCYKVFPRIDPVWLVLKLDFCHAINYCNFDIATANVTHT